MKPVPKGDNTGNALTCVAGRGNTYDYIFTTHVIGIQAQTTFRDEANLFVKKITRVHCSATHKAFEIK
ncbi:hypothetical protein BgiMline_007286, partial [Biomphalaria glabrata]